MIWESEREHNGPAGGSSRACITGDILGRPMTDECWTRIMTTTANSPTRAGPPPADSINTISPLSPTPTTAGASSATTNADAAVADRMTVTADTIDRMEDTLNALATTVGNAGGANKPVVLGELPETNHLSKQQLSYVQRFQT
ncbi:hypothetical protein FN846DRAFT_893090 [Sphaerosporella brunnea]|uniref:Uncharacterized protein n=1 Tax=Sphaerosporella brunnea TaxID=1250544 RepID=A0A5J5ELU7_9PEZI|nr:hypothetical protein FN846DRAFT_893090 [Sphaerosporella brunnea]